MKTNITWLALLLLLGFQWACSSAPPPEPPPAEIQQNADLTSSDSDTSSDDDWDTSSRDEEEEISWKLGTFEVSDEKMQEDIEACREKGKFFDPFEGDEGECLSDTYLANMDCTEAGVLSILSEKDQDTFKDALDDQFDDYEFLACVDCPPDNSLEACEKSNGDEFEGTRVVLAIERDGIELSASSMYVNKRPNADAGRSGSSSSGDDDDDDDDDADADDTSDEDEE